MNKMEQCMNKKNLLSIGKLAKMIGVHIKSLRYYDQIWILFSGILILNLAISSVSDMETEI